MQHATQHIGDRDTLRPSAWGRDRKLARPLNMEGCFLKAPKGNRSVRLLYA
jgi:hypothetical protein